MPLTSVSLNQLRLDEKVNVRRTGRGADPAMIASIAAKGVIEPLIVRMSGNGYAVINGGKRLAALQAMKADGAMANGVLVDAGFMVPIIIRDDGDREARDTSLATAVMRTPLHPVDEYEAFAELRDAGLDAAEIARRYGLKERQVAQRLALGGLAPIIRDAWRDDKIGAESAQAYTLQRDPAAQEKLFRSLAKRGLANSAWQIRGEIAGNDNEMRGLLDGNSAR